MSIAISPTQSVLQKALGEFLVRVLPSGTEVIVGQQNRVPEPKPSNFVTMTPILRSRIETNVDDSEDVLLTGSIVPLDVETGTLTVTEIDYGELQAGSPIFGVSVADNTEVIEQLTGDPGGVGTYSVSPSQTVTSRALGAGITSLAQNMQVTMQIDVHGLSSSDNAQIISTCFNDKFAVEFFAALVPSVPITPLFSVDPRQIPFINAEKQYEDRWIVDVNLQANQSALVPQQFADVVDVDVVNVEATYPL